MKVLVAGSTGSLMKTTITYLKEAGHEILGIDKTSQEESEISYEFYQDDLTDISVANKHTKGVDAIIQSAATIYGVGGFHKYPASILSNDLTLHLNLLESARLNKIHRFVYISSSMVYERCNRVPVSEEDVEDSLIPSTGYGLSKLVGERACKAFHQEFGIDYTIWRPFNIITPYEQAGYEPGISHVFADFIKAICVDHLNPMPIIGDGEQIRCFTWIEDVASAIANFSFKEETKNEIINLGNPKPVNMKQLATAIYELANFNKEDLRFIHLTAPDDDVRIRIPDITKARTRLNWNPSVDLEEALNICVSYFMKQSVR